MKTADQIYFVRHGTAKAAYDGRLVNPTVTTPGQIRGTGYIDASEYTIAPGDIVWIPRNQLHFVDPGVGKVGYSLRACPHLNQLFRSRLPVEEGPSSRCGCWDEANDTPQRLVFIAMGAAIAPRSLYGTTEFTAQSKVPINPPYRIIAAWPQVPVSLKLGAVPGIQIGPDGNIYAFHRCGADSCVGSNDPTILKFDRSGKLLNSWGAGMFNFPHGIGIDREGFVWVADATGLSASQRTENGKGHQVFKFSPDGKLLMTLGTAGSRWERTGHIFLLLPMLPLPPMAISL